MPAAVANNSWATAEAAERLAGLVRSLVSRSLPRIRKRLDTDEAKRLSTVFLEESKLPQPQSFCGVVCSLPSGVLGQSIGARFVGRADLMRDIHRALSGGSVNAARLTGRITAGGGFGKTRLAIEYLHRYAGYYPGGIFWVNGASSAIEMEFWRVLSVLCPNVPDLAVMRSQGRDVRGELERALRKIGQPALYVIDNIPEAGQGSQPLSISDFCPAVGAVAVLATSRQDTREENVRTIPIDTLGRDSAILLLTDNVHGAATLCWTDWGLIAEWVGNLPIALDLLNRCLALSSIAPRVLLDRVHFTDHGKSTTAELDRLRDALRGQVPENAVRGITEAFLISFEKLGRATQQAAQLLAQLAPAPIPAAFMDALPDQWKSPDVRSALRSRHFLTGGDDLSFGAMHRLMADFIRSLTGDTAPELLKVSCTVLAQIMTPDGCRDPRQWQVMRLCRPHAEALFARGSHMDATELTSTEVGTVAWLLPKRSTRGSVTVPHRVRWVLEQRF